MAAMFFATFLGFGVVAGLVARKLMPGPNPAGVFGTILIGISAGLAIGLIGSLLVGVPITAFDGRSLLMAISGTLFALLAYRAFALRWPDEQATTPRSVRPVVADTLKTAAKRA